MKNKLLKILSLSCLMIPNFSCNSSPDKDGFKEVKHIDFALKGIECINRIDNFTKVTITGTQIFYRENKINQINRVGSVKDKDIIIEDDPKIELNYNISTHIRGEITPYYYLCIEDDFNDIKYFTSENGCKIEKSYFFEGCLENHCGETYIDVFTWNNYGLLEYLEIASTGSVEFNTIYYVLKLNFAYED